MFVQKITELIGSGVEISAFLEANQRGTFHVYVTNRLFCFSIQLIWFLKLCDLLL